MNAVGAATSLPGLEPDLDCARELARSATVVPVRYRFIDDTETPVSAFLKLRGDGPAFLLESAEQGRLGRWSFLGFRPRAILRWSDGSLSEWSGETAAESGTGAAPDRVTEAPDPYAAAGRIPGPLRDRGARRAAPIRGRRGGLLRLRPCSHRRATARAEPRPNRAARHGPDDHRRTCRLRPPAPRGDADRQRIRRGRRDRGGIRPRRGDDRGGAREAPRAGARRRADDGEGPDRLPVQYEPGAVRGDRLPDHRVRPRRRRVPGGPVAALHLALPGRGLLDLQGPAHGQSLALHVLPRLRRLRDRRRVARAPGQGDRGSRRDQADRRHLSARRRRGGGPPGRRAPACRTRRSAPST